MKVCRRGDAGLVRRALRRASLVRAGAIQIAACANSLHQPVAGQIEVRPPTGLAPKLPGRHPGGPEVLAFQSYGRVIADRRTFS